VQLTRIVIALGTLCWLAGEAIAAGPQQCREGLCHTHPPNPIAPGRPSPPPCCADGVCYPNYMTWGHYATRWRRWPIEYPTPLPEELRPAPPLGPDMLPFEPPSAEEEDQRAPPPTAPRGEAPAAPAGEAPAEPPAGAPAGQPAERPATAPLGPPTPGAEQPTGDWDPPPTPPFSTPALSGGQPVRAAGRIEAAPLLPPKRAAPPASTDDPPPQLPLAMASWAN
jgi:hypothetical protein